MGTERVSLAGLRRGQRGIREPVERAGGLWELAPTFFDALLNDFEGFAEGCDGRAILPKIGCPVLFLRGESKLGAAMTDEEFAWLQHGFRNVQIAEIQGAGHLPHLQDEGRTPVLATRRCIET